MAAIDLKTLTPDTTLPATAVIFGADDQTVATPSVFPIAKVLEHAAAATGTSALDITKTYAANDVVIHNGHIYRANGAVAAGAFDATKWTEIGAPPPAFQTETETAPTIAAGTLNLDCSAGNVFAVNLNADVTTVNFTNVPPAGRAYGMTLALTVAASHTITWPASVKWPDAKAPTLSTDAGKIDVFTFVTWDAGVTWLAFVAGQKL